MLILETLTWEVQLESVRDGEDGLNFLRRQKLLWCGPVFISIREGGFVGRFPDPEMNQFAQAATQTIADLTQRVGMGELAEQHRHQLRPATEAFGAPFGLVLLDQRSELGARKMLEQLIEQTGGLYDWGALLFPGSGQDGAAANEQMLLSINYRRLFLWTASPGTQLKNLFWTRVIAGGDRRLNCLVGGPSRQAMRALLAAC